MNFKKLTFLAIFAVSQIAMITPVSADDTTPIKSDTAVTEAVYGSDAGETDPLIIDNTGEANGTSTDLASSGKLILKVNGAEMLQDGILYTASQPMTVKKGVSYIAVRSLVDRIGLTLTYDSKTKETVIISGSNELRFKLNSNKYTVNGVSQVMKGTSYQQENIFMVPLTAITEALHIPYVFDGVQKQVILTLSTKPVASFTVQQKEIIAGETLVTYVTNSSSPKGFPIVEERWEGREDIFQEVGTHTVTYAVLDSNGEWSDPYTITIEVKAPNLPPVAMFTTDKDEYKMGELITINDISTDEDNDIVKRNWLNNELAFFRSGPVTIQLEVIDGHGAVGTYEKTINITNERLYSEPDFNKLFVPVGRQYRFDGSTVPTMEKVQYTMTSEPATLIRSNSPETVYSEGVVYRETAAGLTRFMVHHVNALGKDVRMYVIATNKNLTPATVNILDSGFAGPNMYATLVGKLSVQRYYKSMQNNLVEQSVALAPGESKIIFNELNALEMKPMQVISLLADVNSDLPVEYTVIMIDADQDALTSIPYLMDIARDGVHNRGTYPNSTRLIEYNDVLGLTNQRISLGDNTGDPNLTGVDALTGLPESNLGNFGVMYKVTLNRVAANTLITFNPRGGEYSGMLLVNGNIIGLPEGNGAAGSLATPNDTSVVYRTGDHEQKVEIWFTPAPGSNLPVNLLFQQMPERK
ncbi:copper amine oxidase N-terminal domain-containing protein [Paenibacillus crassostreae]|uniref:DNA-directed RNA polymerase subunit beta n=1 Tax=Paenibacillus crassostreae TaxID=1763538 RepID=A0A167DGY6_9BACL|nr:copper amine oxidase N-terminal domain-containing protein [Paenibacillus crassostreae]AOZ91486.1 DNA-directed RNA polymerase subunit beta [Paenibacillus crassostreae]OAB74355.1 DNA-directed RNA polymerase subunit beta [Paenibacillus crassostreae]